MLYIFIHNKFSKSIKMLWIIYGELIKITQIFTTYPLQPLFHLLICLHKFINVISNYIILLSFILSPCFLFFF